MVIRIVYLSWNLPLKLGSVVRTDRTVKWNETIRIGEKLGKKQNILKNIFLIR